MKLPLVILALLAAFSGRAQDWLKPADSLDTQRQTTVLITGGIAYGLTLFALDRLWYSDYQRSSFQLKNDNVEWLQMDKAGHGYAAYHLSRLGAEAMAWSGSSKKTQLVAGTASALGFLTAIEIMDGHSKRWGFSWGDMAANVAGAGLFAGQELLWQEQRIIPKFSFHTTPYASERPEALGASVPEQVFKDYNGQTYWLSANLQSFGIAKSPSWLNLAFGYGAEGMITANDDLINTVFLPEKSRFRQYYLSLDADLTKIKTDSATLRTLFSIFNTIKIPAPALEINEKGIVKFHPAFF